MRLFSLLLFIIAPSAFADVQLPLTSCRLSGVVVLDTTHASSEPALKINRGTYSEKIIRLKGVSKSARALLTPEKQVTLDLKIEKDRGRLVADAKFARFVGDFDGVLPIYFSASSVKKACNGLTAGRQIKEIDPK